MTTADKLDPRDKALRATALARQYHDRVKTIAARTGIGAAGSRGEAARVYVVLLLAYYLGKTGAPIPPRELSTHDLEKWAKRRAWDELERAAHLLPAMLLEREPAA